MIYTLLSWPSEAKHVHRDTNPNVLPITPSIRPNTQVFPIRRHLVTPPSRELESWKEYSQLFNPHQRCGYSDSPFARIHYFYTAGSRNRFEGMEAVCPHTKKHKTISKIVFLIEKCFEDARQDEKHVPDLLESIMTPTDPVKDELRQKLFKITQFESKIGNMRVSKF